MLHLNLMPPPGYSKPDLTIMAATPADIERFNSKLHIGEGGCLLWEGTKFRGGYGRFTINGGSVLHEAHTRTGPPLPQPCLL